MTPPNNAEIFARIAAVAATGCPMEELLTTTLPLVQEVTGAAAAAVVDAGTDQEVPETWRALGVVETTWEPLVGTDGWLLLGWSASGALTVPALCPALAALLGGALARLAVVDELADLVARVDDAQRLADMGDYDWHIPSDTTRWSDQLYRIYGCEPQSFNASYERFISFVHPDDRERIRAIHARSYETGEPYEMVERIVRPDGEIRHLASNGRVIFDEHGRPVRMRGTCIDITNRIHADEERDALSAHVREAQTRRLQALEINDNVVQSLAAARHLLREGETDASEMFLERTLAAARKMMDDLLEPLDGQDLHPGDLVRVEPTAVTPGLKPKPVGAPRGAGPSTRHGATATRVLVVDDSADLRMLVRSLLEREPGFEVVGEAGDGRAAVAKATELRPDVVVLDLAMPVMDGWQTLPRLAETVPDATVVILSGFDEATMGERTRLAGAHVYVEKGDALGDLPAVIADAVARRAAAMTSPTSTIDRATG